VALRALRDRGVLILGSGGFTHNLYEIAPKNSVPEGYITLFSDWMREAVVARDFERLANYRKLAPYAERAHPTDEHLLPLLVALGASFDDDPLHIEYGDIYYGMLSMESYFWGPYPTEAI
jgi:4,5-DOPA dioxygenase extradiol